MTGCFLVNELLLFEENKQSEAVSLGTTKQRVDRCRVFISSFLNGQVQYSSEYDAYLKVCVI